MKNLEQELLAKIEEALPSQMSGLLKERLKHLEEIEIEHNELLVEHAETKSQLEQQEKLASQRRVEISTFKVSIDAIEIEKKNIEKDRSTIREREKLLELKEKHAQEKCDLMLELYKIPFANRQLRETLTTETPRYKEYVTTGTQYDNNANRYEEHIVRDDEIVEIKTETIKEES